MDFPPEAKPLRSQPSPKYVTATRPRTTLIDNVMLLFGSNMLDGDIHDGRDLPLILAGGGGGALRSGLNLDVSDRTEPEQRLCNLHLTLANRVGMKLNHFGDSVGEVADVLL